MVTIDQDEKSAKPILEKIQGITSVELKQKANGNFQYSLKAKPEITPNISNAMYDAGFKLYELTLEKRNLETLFTEVCSNNMQ